MPDTITAAQFEDAYRNGFGRIEAILRNLGAKPDLAEDLTQEAWSVGWKKRHQLKDPGRAIGWVTSIAVNLWRDRQRGGRKSTFFCDGFEAAVAPNISLAAMDIEIALAGCSERQRTLLRRIYLNEESMAEVAQSLSISVDALQHRLSRARRGLRRILKTAA